MEAQKLKKQQRKRRRWLNELTNEIALEEQPVQKEIPSSHIAVIDKELSIIVVGKSNSSLFSCSTQSFSFY